jgi:hypothetical protein
LIWSGGAAVSLERELQAKRTACLCRVGLPGHVEPTGRAEERTSQPALITGERGNWLANNHVMRVGPKPGVNPGWLDLCFASRHVQLQVKASSCGSVVAAVYPVDLNDVLVPGPDEARGNFAFEAWKDLGTASMLEATAINSLERAILSATTYSR